MNQQCTCNLQLSTVNSVQFSHLVVSDFLRAHELQRAPPHPSPTPGVHSDSRPSSQWCHPATSSSVLFSSIPFSSCPQSLPASESFPMSQLLLPSKVHQGHSWCCTFHCSCCSVTQSCPALFDPIDCSTWGFPVLHRLPEFAQTHVHWVSDAIQSSHPLSSRSPLAFNPASIRIFSNKSGLHIRWPKYWSFSFSISPSNE